MRLIDADALWRIVKLAWDTSDSEDFENSVFIAIGTAPTIDTVKHGRWEPWDLSWGRSVWSCSVCRDAMEVPTEMGAPIYKFCPNCGARMEGEEG